VKHHIAFLNNCGWGHVIPTLDVVAELVGRGHRVTYVTAGPPVSEVAAVGAEVVEHQSRLLEIDFAKVNTVEDGLWMLALTVAESEQILKATVGRFTEDVPTALVYDTTVHHAGRVLARSLGLPAVASHPMLQSNEHFSLPDKEAEVVGHRMPRRHPAVREFQTRLLRLLTDHGQSDLSLTEFLATVEGLNLSYHPRSFQFAGDTFDGRFVFAGPGLRPRQAERGWSPPDDGRPVLLITLGTSVHRRPGFYRTCLEAFAESGWHVVIGAYSGVDRSELAGLPANVEVLPWVPVPAVLEHARVLLCHGGMGTIMAAMHRATPVVVLPEAAEQMVNGERVAELGLGRVMRSDDVTAQALRAAVEGVAADPAIGCRVDAMRRDILDAGGGTRAADAIEEYLARAADAAATGVATRVPAGAATGGATAGTTPGAALW